MSWTKLDEVYSVPCPKFGGRKGAKCRYGSCFETAVHGERALCSCCSSGKTACLQQPHVTVEAFRGLFFCCVSPPQNRRTNVVGQAAHVGGGLSSRERYARDAYKVTHDLSHGLSPARPLRRPSRSRAGQLFRLRGIGETQSGLQEVAQRGTRRPHMATGFNRLLRWSAASIVVCRRACSACTRLAAQPGTLRKAAPNQ